MAFHVAYADKNSIKPVKEIPIKEYINLPHAKSLELSNRQISGMLWGSTVPALFQDQ
jgi:hypothetical protein